MATLKISDKSISRYFGFLKNMDTQSKKKLIIQLTDSIESKETTKKGIDHLFGAWEDTKTAEEMISEIRGSRTQNREIEGFE
ncbi:MAG: hypothetical protein RIC30_01985 [Marinoscillum sp.]|uniref:hypothetical protein n=1 Tax=Marinoscillum sp. TaxID=2024838 RepID=UPI0032F61A2E